MVIYNKNVYSTSLQCLLEVDILAGVLFSILLLCCAYKSSYPSNAKSSSRLVAWSSNCSSAAWSLNCSSAASSSKLILASFKTPALEEAAAEMGGCSAAPISHGLPLGSQKTLCRLRPHRGHVTPSSKTLL